MIYGRAVLRPPRGVAEDLADVFTAKRACSLSGTPAAPFCWQFATHEIHVPSRSPSAVRGGPAGCGVRGERRAGAWTGAAQDPRHTRPPEDRGPRAHYLTVNRHRGRRRVTRRGGRATIDGTVPWAPLRGGKYSLVEGGTRVRHGPLARPDQARWCVDAMMTQGAGLWASSPRSAARISARVRTRQPRCLPAARRLASWPAAITRPQLRQARPSGGVVGGVHPGGSGRAVWQSGTGTGKPVESAYDSLTRPRRDEPPWRPSTPSEPRRGRASSVHPRGRRSGRLSKAFTLAGIVRRHQHSLGLGHAKPPWTEKRARDNITFHPGSKRSR